MTPSPNPSPAGRLAVRLASIIALICFLALAGACLPTRPTTDRSGPVASDPQPSATKPGTPGSTGTTTGSAATGGSAATSGGSGSTSCPAPSGTTLSSGTTAGSSQPSVNRADARASIAAVGDIITHQMVIDGAKVAGTDRYDFAPDFQYVRDILGAADLAAMNFEGSLPGPPFTGFPLFRAPDELPFDMAKAGFDIAWMPNNHTYDGKSTTSFYRMLDVIKQSGLRAIGARPSVQARSDAIVNLNGIRVGLLAYSYETGKDGKKNLNGNSVPAEIAPLIDTYNIMAKADQDRDIADLLVKAAALRREGAELIVLSMHWGTEWVTTSSAHQRALAQQLCDGGIEVIVGHHPHVLQEIVVLNQKAGDGQTLVFYSVGNFLHNMLPTDHNNKGYALDAIIARIVIERRDGKTRVSRAEVIPTFVSWVDKGKLRRHLIVPVIPALQNPSAYQSNKKLLQASLDRTRGIMARNKPSESIAIVEKAR